MGVGCILKGPLILAVLPSGCPKPQKVIGGRPLIAKSMFAPDATKRGSLIGIESGTGDCIESGKVGSIISVEWRQIGRHKPIDFLAKKKKLFLGRRKKKRKKKFRCLFGKSN